MKILSIETSCDETAISIVQASGKFKNPKFKILEDVVLSQVKLHAEYGGVFPNLAKREHCRNLIPVLEKTLPQDFEIFNKIPSYKIKKLQKIFEREPELLEQFLQEIPKIKMPDIDAIAVTHGPGLEPALWVGINFAKALSLVWDKPLIPVNHMEGHIFSAFMCKKEFQISNFQFPALSLLVSGGHTELILIKDWMKYEKIGQTRDDAAGEAFDKVARILELPYPGGPEISKLAQIGDDISKLELPRPMLNSDNFDFSFSGLKTAVLYMVKNISELTPKTRAAIAKEFQQAAIDVLVSKTIKAARTYMVKTIIMGGGVSANKELREQLKTAIEKKLPNTEYRIPDMEYTGDNAAMIAVAGYFNFLDKGAYKNPLRIKAQGNLSL